GVSGPCVARHPADDIQPRPKALHRQVEAAAEVEASTQPSENHRPAVARRIVAPGEDGFEDLRRLAYMTLIQQLLATPALDRVTLLRGHQLTSPLIYECIDR